MNKKERTFRDKLLELNKPNQSYKDKYEKEIKKMLEKKLNYLWRAGFGILSLLGLLVAVPFLKLAFAHMGRQNDLGLFVRIVTVSGAILALAWMVLMGWITATGKLNLKNHPTYMATIGIAIGFFLIAYFLFILVLPIAIIEPIDYRSICGIHLALLGFFFVVTISLCLIIRALYRVEFRTREKLLQIEYRLADMAEKLENKNSE